MTSANNISWFHCGRCGSLFQSAAGEPDDRLCPSCGCSPYLNTDPTTTDPIPTQRTTPLPETTASARVKAPSRRRKRSYLVVKLIIIWVAILGAIIFTARKFGKDGSTDRPVSQTSHAADNQSSTEDVALINQAGPEISAALNGFFSANTPESRNQFVSSPITTAARMAHFYAMNPVDDIDLASLTLKGTSVVQIPGKTAVETQLSSADGRLLDVTFFREDGEWKIDWDHFVRYSESPWPLFLSGSGEAEGEFRLLARERLPEERKDEDTISLVLYAPRFGYANETGFQSPEFIVPRDSRNGRLLDAAFKLQKSGKRVFGVKNASINPEGLIRIRVKIRRSEEDKIRHFEIEDILACHWYSDDHMGLDVTDAAPAK